MIAPAVIQDDDLAPDGFADDGDGSFIPLSDPDITQAELDAVEAALRSPRLSSGPTVEAFEAAFAAYVGRKYAVAVPSGTIGLLIALASYGIGPEHEVIASPYSFRETAHAISLVGARPVFSDIDYWAGTLVPEKVEARITEKTRAIVACNNNGHPAPHPPRGLDRGDRLEISRRAGRHIRRRRSVRFLPAFAVDLRRGRHGRDR
jgi:perosamine synthetase